jgi:drug/metabolite transporter superfamily protein YnfA
MSSLRSLKKLLFGETWLLPAGIAVCRSASLLIRALAPDAWDHLGGLILLAGILGVLLASTARTSRRR